MLFGEWAPEGASLLHSPAVVPRGELAASLASISTSVRRKIIALTLQCLVMIK